MNVTCKSLEKPLNDEVSFGKDESGFSFQTEYFDNQNIFDSQKIETETPFEISIREKSDTNTYKMSCRLWKTDDNRINSICRIQGQVQSGRYYLNDASFTYNNYNIIISSNCGTFKVVQYDFSIPYLYAPKQVINNNNVSQKIYLDFLYYIYIKEILKVFIVILNCGKKIFLQTLSLNLIILLVYIKLSKYF